jgi:hypothetical protein
VAERADDLEARLAAAAEAVREREITEHRCRELEGRIDEAKQHIETLQAAHGVELKDVARLEGISLTRVLASLRGSRDDRLAREQAEADAVALRLWAAESQLDALKQERSSAAFRVRALASASGRYRAVLDEKERLLAQSDDPRASRMLVLADEGGRAAGELREIDEALRAASAARAALVHVQERLDSAGRWSTYDTFWGGGMFSSMAKHGRLDEAAAAAAHADERLTVLRTELADVRGMDRTGLHVTVKGSTRFLDVWFDNIFTDWSVHDRIKKAQQNVVRCLDLVQRARARLDEAASRTKVGLEAIQTEREHLLTDAPT